jgi:LmbE family N-acetylglucosaminyl deacetylase
MNEAIILSPHYDDEVLGATSFLTSSALVIYCAGDLPFPGNVREKESKVVASSIPFRAERLDYVDTELPSKLIGMASRFTLAIKRHQPGTVLIPAPSYHQDHRAVHEAAKIALRIHDTNHLVKRVLVYEGPGSFQSLEPVFHPTFFREVDIEKKIALLALYVSQARGHREPDLVRSMAYVRGGQSGMAYAEGFQVLRWIE